MQWLHVVSLVCLSLSWGLMMFVVVRFSDRA